MTSFFCREMLLLLCMKNFIIFIFLIVLLSGCTANQFIYLEEPQGNLLKIRVAETKEEKRVGLSGVKELSDFHGMLFLEDKPRVANYWMKGMNFPLDFVFLDEKRQVIEIKYNQPVCSSEDSCPVIYSESNQIMYVLELPAGKCEEYRISVGNYLNW